MYATKNQPRPSRPSGEQRLFCRRGRGAASLVSARIEQIDHRAKNSTRSRKRPGEAARDRVPRGHPVRALLEQRRTREPMARLAAKNSQERPYATAVLRRQRLTSVTSAAKPSGDDARTATRILRCRAALHARARQDPPGNPEDNERAAPSTCQRAAAPMRNASLCQERELERRRDDDAPRAALVGSKRTSPRRRPFRAGVLMSRP